jgi:PHS family inorganic phosphate transporter-like MFS transporter
MANFFQNFGPNTTTFIIPGEVFPTRYRSTAHGICAASGKLGAIIAQFLPHILEIFALFMLTGVFSTLLLPETMNKSLEDLAQDDDDDYERDARVADTPKTQ